MNYKTTLCTAALCLAQVGLGAAAAQAETDYIYASFASPELPDSKAIQAFLDTVNENSSNIHFDASFGGAMGGPRELISNISTGVVSAGNIIDGYAPKQLAANSVLRVLGTLGGDQIAVSGAVNETILLDCPRCIEDMENLDVLGLGNYAVPGYVLICRAPFDGYDQFKALRIRSAGEFAQVFAAVGATPVQIPFPETYEALERGQVECSHSQQSYLRAANFWDVAKDVYDQPPLGIYNTAQLFAVNKSVWDGFDEADKDIILSALPMAIADAVFRGMEETDEISAAAEEKGVTFRPLPDDVTARIDAYRGRENLDKVIAELGDSLGYDEATALIDVYLENLDKWTEMLPEISQSREAFADALDRDVYSKVDM